MKNFGNKICDNSLNNNFWNENFQKYYLKTKQNKNSTLWTNVQNKKETFIAENIVNKKVDIQKEIIFGNEILEEKILIKILKNKDIGVKLFLNSLERNFESKKIAEQNL